MKKNLLPFNVPCRPTCRHVDPNKHLNLPRNSCSFIEELQYKHNVSQFIFNYYLNLLAGKYDVVCDTSSCNLWKDSCQEQERPLENHQVSL